MFTEDNSPDYIYTDANLQDDEYFASLEAMVDAATASSHKASNTEVDRSALLASFQLIERAVNGEGLTDEQAENLIAKAERKLSAARPQKTDKFEDVNLASLVDVASAPIPMLVDAFETDGKSLLPKAELIWLSAPPASGKSFVTTSQCLELARAGKRSVYVDFESTATVIVRRLLQLGATEEELALITYLSPSKGWSGAEMNLILHQAARHVIEKEAELLVIDGFAQASVRLGFDENSNTDMSLFADGLSGIAYATGVPVLVIDHVSKVAADNGSKWMRGASAKLAQPAMAFRVEVTQSPAMGRTGAIKLVISKDRHGCVGSEGDVAAVVTFVPTDRGQIEGGLQVNLSGSNANVDDFQDLTLMMLARRIRDHGPFSTTELRNLTYDRGDNEGKRCFSRKKFEEVVKPMLEMLVNGKYVGINDAAKGGSNYAWCAGDMTLEEIAARVKSDAAAAERGEENPF